MRTECAVHATRMKPQCPPLLTTPPHTTPNPPPVKSDFVLEENVRAREANGAPKSYGDEDFEARDLRRLSDALNKIAERRSASVGSADQVTTEQVFEWACDIAGISVKRGLEVQRLGRKWPTQTGLGTSA